MKPRYKPNAEQWLDIGVNMMKSKCYLDVTRIKFLAENTVEVHILASPGFGGRGVAYRVMHMIYDLDKLRFITLTNTNYAADGRVIFRTPDEDGFWQEVPEQSPMIGLAEALKESFYQASLEDRRFRSDRTVYFN